MNEPLRDTSNPDDRAEPVPMKRCGQGLLRSREKDSQADKGNEIWLLTLSDLLMLLTIFFVMLFGMTLQPSPQARASLPTNIPNPALQEPDRYVVLEKDLTATLSSGKEETGTLIQRQAGLVLLTFPEPIVFDPGEAQLKPSSQATLAKVASFIQERPHLLVEVQGHTDDQPIHTARYPSNWELSVDRATQVARALISLGVNPIQLSAKGFGEYRPLLPNESDVSRLKNRRVEIQFSLPPQS